MPVGFTATLNLYIDVYPADDTWLMFLQDLQQMIKVFVTSPSNEPHENTEFN